MNHTVNLAIQVLPLGTATIDAYRIIDKVIEVIQRSGLKFVVSPFETVVEGAYSRVMQLLEEVQSACMDAGADTVLINMKLHRSFSRDVYIDDKIGKYTSR